MKLNLEQIKQIIPHRDPFLLIDEILECEAGVRAVGTKLMTPDSFWFKGHFPDHPVTPGVLMVEMLAQVGAVSILMLPEYKGKIALFAGIESIKFKRQVVPNDLLTLQVEIEKIKLGVGTGVVLATVGGEKAVEGKIKFAIGK